MKGSTEMITPQSTRNSPKSQGDKMECVMGHRVTEILREAGDYFAVLIEIGAVCGMVGGYIILTPNRTDVEALVESSKLDDMDFEDVVDRLILKNSPKS